MTEEGGQPRHVLQSIGAVLAGLIVGAVLSIGTDWLLQWAGIFPGFGQRFPDKLLMLATAYRTVYSILGSYITARLAPYRPMLHAVWGGIVGLILSVTGAVMTWNAGPEYGPHWYPVVLVVLVMPCAWAGAAVYVRSET